jgi:hypothetical protein
MSKISLRQIKDYFLLLIITGSAIVLSLMANGNKDSIKKIVIGLAVVYVLWGVLHHKNEKTLKKEIFFEYLIISVLGSALVIALL